MRDRASADRYSFIPGFQSGFGGLEREKKRKTTTGQIYSLKGVDLGQSYPLKDVDFGATYPSKGVDLGKSYFLMG